MYPWQNQGSTFLLKFSISPLWHTQVAHGIKLYPPGAPANVVPTDTESPVVAESYDEIVFTDPTESFYNHMQRLSSAPPISNYSQEAHFGQFSDTEDFQALLEAQKFLQEELIVAKERLQLVDTDMQEVDEALREIQERKAGQQRTRPPPSRSAAPAPAAKKTKP